MISLYQSLAQYFIHSKLEKLEDVSQFSNIYIPYHHVLALGMFISTDKVPDLYYDG